MGYPETSVSGKYPELTQITKYKDPQLFPEVNKKGLNIILLPTPKLGIY
jgi:hypothetical protein